MARIEQSERIEGRYDVAVVGAGPAGATAAIAFARTGARVLLLEGNPKARLRFAGEWLHPPGVEVLDRLGVTPLRAAAQHSSGRGFVVFPDDGGEPIELSYADDGPGMSCEHATLVEALRDFAVELPGIDYAPWRRVVHVEEGQLDVARRGGAQERVLAGLVVGADGRASVTRRHLGLEDNSTLLSYMAGVELEGVDLPFEGFGHVILGGPGPILLYRIAPGRARMCLDLPVATCGDRRDATFLWRAFAPVLPPSLVPAFRAALESGRLSWAACRFRPRTEYGRGRVALIGDAVGYVHPLTAVGMTLGLDDAFWLAESDDVNAYRRNRERQSYVAELLSNALYHAFQRPDASAENIRAAIYRMWGESPAERQRTMRILTGADHRSASFAAAFLRVAVGAVGHIVGGGDAGWLDPRRWREMTRSLVGQSAWLQWPAASLLPRPVRNAVHARSTSDRPIPEFPLRLPEPEPLDAELSTERAAPTALLALQGQVADALCAAPSSAAAVAGLGVAAGELRRAQAESARAALLDQPGDGAVAETASRLIALLAGAPDAPIETVNALARDVLMAQHDRGGFGEPGRLGRTRPDVRTTALCCRALRAVRRRWPGVLVNAIEQASARAAAWVRARQDPSGAWSLAEEPSVLATSWGIEALLACGASAGEPALRRGWRWLCVRQARDGRWSAPGSDPVLATARAVRALVASKAPYHEAASAGARVLVERTRPETADVQTLWAVAEAVDAFLQRPVEELGRTARALAAGDTTFCRDALRAVSRTFARPIEMLDEPLRTAVTCSYLLCRIADTVEDLPDLDPAVRGELFARFLSVLAGEAPAADFASAFARVGADPDDPETDLALGLDRVMRVFGTASVSTRDACRRWIAEMVRGMELYGRRAPGPDGIVSTATVRDLERYCWFVAGTVGQLLTELFVEALPDLERERELELHRRAESFGVALQLVNILKDITDDHARQVSYVPRLACAERGIEPGELLDPAHRELAHAALAPLFDRAEVLLGEALDYTLALPASARPVRLFCMLPLWMAVRTLVHARGNDAQFVPGAPVKISRAEVESLIVDCVGICDADDALIRARYDRLWGRQPAALSVLEAR